MKLLTATPQELALLTANGEINPQTAEQQKVLANRLAQKVTLGDLAHIIPPLVKRTVAPHMLNLGSAVQDMTITYLALVELLVEKGVITSEEVQAKEAEVLGRFQKANAQMKANAEVANAGEQTETPDASTENRVGFAQSEPTPTIILP